MIYLASPYSDPDPEVREQRFRAVCKHAAGMMRRGERVLSPIAHTHPIAIASGGTLMLGWDFWERYDTELVKMCDEVRVLKLPGWEESVGVQAEIELARKMGKAVRYEEPEP
jgi:hypothetical protein